jgi:AcrR family transcriptional regulator
MQEGLTAAPKAAASRASRASGIETREKILDAAEALFAGQSFDSVSLRDITLRADVTLALASYHFGSKEALFEAVVARRADVLRALREARLAKVVEPDVRALLDAFIAPLFEIAKSGDAGWRAYLRVLAQLGEQDRWVPLLSRRFDATAELFLEAIRNALPGADPGEVARAFLFLLDSMLRAVSQHARLDVLTGGEASARDLERAYPTLLTFATAGMQAVGQAFPHPANN